MRILKDIPIKAARDQERYESLDERIIRVDRSINERIDILI